MFGWLIIFPTTTEITNCERHIKLRISYFRNNVVHICRRTNISRTRTYQQLSSTPLVKLYVNSLISALVLRFQQSGTVQNSEHIQCERPDTTVVLMQRTVLGRLCIWCKSGVRTVTNWFSW